MKKTIILLALSLTSCIHAQLPQHIFQVTPYAGAQGRVDFQSTSGTFTVHVQAASALATNNIFAFPINTVTTAAAGNCLTLLSTSQGTTEWDPCGGTSPPVVWTLGTSSTTLSVTNTSSGDAFAANASGAYAVHTTGGDSLFEGSVKVGRNSSTFWALIPTTVLGNEVLEFNSPGGVDQLKLDANNNYNTSFAALYVTPTTTIGAAFNIKGVASANVVDITDALSSNLLTISYTGQFTGPHIQNLGSSDSPTFSAPVFTTSAYVGDGTSTTHFDIDYLAGSARVATLSFRSAGQLRWQQQVTGSEGGSNAGSDFSIRRYNDGGSVIDSPIQITRSTGLTTFVDAVTVAGVTTLNGSVSGTHAQSVGTGDSPTFVLGIFTIGVTAAGISATSNGISSTVPSSGFAYTAEGGGVIIGGTTQATTTLFSGRTTSASSTIAMMHMVDSNGTCNLAYNVGGVFSCSSDSRLKTDITYISNRRELANILKLRPATFHMKKNPTGDLFYGYIAQDFLDVYPEMVKTDEDGFYTLAYGELVPRLVEAIKELKSEIDVLKSCVFGHPCVVEIDRK